MTAVITPETLVRIVDEQAGEIIWTGTWADFLAENLEGLGEDGCGMVKHDLETHSASIFGGGAQPILLLEVAQTYRLPPGWTWRMVVAQRVRWDLNERHYPLASLPGVATAWGRPLGVTIDE
jgi:hypothetical protein